MNILICGNYGATNIGDELILEGLLTLYPKEKITVLSYSPEQTEKDHKVLAVFFLPAGFRSFLKSFLGLKIFKTLKAYFQADEFIFGGGGLMQDDNSKAIFIWGIHLFLAILLRKKVRILGNSVGPLRYNCSKKIVKFLFNKACEITVRDEKSLKLLKEIDVKGEIKLVQDLALNIKISNYRLPVANYKNYLILSLRKWLNEEEKEKFESEIIKLCNYFIREKGYEIIAIPFEKLRDDDERYLAVIKEKIENKNLFHVQKYCSDLNKIFELYSQAKLVIGMRLHAIILAHKFNKPFIALSYSPKVRGFCESVGKEKRCFDVREVDANRIIKSS